MGSNSGCANLGIYLYNVDTGSTTCQDYQDGVVSVYRSCANSSRDGHIHECVGTGRFVPLMRARTRSPAKRGDVSCHRVPPPPGKLLPGVPVAVVCGLHVPFPTKRKEHP